MTERTSERGHLVRVPALLRAGAVRFGTVVLLLLLLPAIGCRSQAPPAGDGTSVQPGVDVRRYEADLVLEPEERRLAGTVAVEVTRPDTLTRLRLFLDGMTVDSVRVGGRPTGYRRTSDTLRVRVPAGDTLSVVEISYRGVPQQGLYRRTYRGQAVVFTDSWPTRARGWLPSVDVPSDPAALTLRLSVPDGYEAVASGVLRSRRAVDDRVVTEWYLNASSPTYSLAFAVSDFAPTSVRTGDGLDVDYYMLDSDSAAASTLSRTPESLAYLTDRLGAYSYENYQVVQVPIEYGGMENAALPFIRARLFDRPDEVESTQVHEAVHMWFGDRVVIARWRDLWLSEGVATYFTTLFYEEVDGIREARRRWVRMVDIPPDELAGQTRLVPDRAVDPNAFLTWVPYQKGASVLHLIRRSIGDEAFFEAMRRTYQQYRDRPLSTPEFKAVLEEHAGRSLDDVFDYWVYGGELPTLRTRWSSETETLTWSVTGDGGTLRDVSYQLRLTRGDTTVYVDAGAGRYRFGSSSEVSGDVRPSVRPVGILMRVDSTPP